MTSATTQQRWWVAGASGAEGPYVEEHVLSWLSSGQLSATTLLCPEGGSEWRAVSAWPQFAPPPPPPIPEQFAIDPHVVSVRHSSSPPTHARLPTMAGWICIYSVAIVPLLLIIGLISFLMTAGSVGSLHPDSQFVGAAFLLDLLTGLRSLGVCVLLVMGGLRLQDRRLSGVALLKTGLWIDVVAAALFFFAYAVVFSAAAVEGGIVETSDASDVIVFGEGVLDLAAFVFDIVALIWLTRNERHLRLPRH